MRAEGCTMALRSQPVVPSFSGNSRVLLLLLLLITSMGQTLELDPLVAMGWLDSLSLENFNASQAHSFLVRSSTTPMEKQQLCRLPLGADLDVPPLHYLLNSYFKSRDMQTRKDVVRLLLYCVEEAEANVTENYNNDPSILFKSLAMREMNLARAISRASASFSSVLVNRMTFSHLYALPCEIVPLAKLLLHANTIVSRNSKGLQGLGGTEGVKKMIQGASLGVQSKPAVKGEDLSLLSPGFTETVSALGFGEFQLTLRKLTQMLDEVAGAMHQHLFSSPQSSALILQILSETEQGTRTRRNGFHHLGITGATIMINQLIEAIGVVDEGAREALSVPLVAADLYGMLPSSYAFARFGGKSDAYQAMLRLCLAVSPSLRSVCDNQHPVNLFVRKRQVKNENFEEALGESVSVNVDGGTTTTTTDLEENGGGWNVNRLKADGLDLLLPDSARRRCDIIEVHGPPPSPEEFLTKYVLTSTPVIFRGAAKGGHLQIAFRKEAFLDVYGTDVTEIGAIPYASSFGVASRRLTMRQIAELDSSASYAFSTPSQVWQRRLLNDAPIPSFVPLDHAAGSWGSTEIQFYLGPAGSGAPMHFHGHAVNTLAWGEKRWFLLPPEEAFYSTEPALQYVTRSQNGSSSHTHDASSSWQCTQQAGDVMYVPSLWSHATLNLKQSIGVAHEFTIEPFCMN